MRAFKVLRVDENKLKSVWDRPFLLNPKLQRSNFVWEIDVRNTHPDSKRVLWGTKNISYCITWAINAVEEFRPVKKLFDCDSKEWKIKFRFFEIEGEEAVDETTNAISFKHVTLIKEIFLPIEIKSTWKEYISHLKEIKNKIEAGEIHV